MCLSEGLPLEAPKSVCVCVGQVVEKEGKQAVLGVQNGEQHACMTGHVSVLAASQLCCYRCALMSLSVCGNHKGSLGPNIQGNPTLKHPNTAEYPQSEHLQE